MKREYLEVILTRWRGLQPRERLVLATGSVVLALMLVFVLVWLPLQRDISQLRLSIPKEQSQLALMRVQATLVKRLRAAGSTRKTTGNLLATLEQSATSHGLRPHISRMEPEGANGVRLSLDGVNFNTLLGWLDELQRQGGMRVENATMEAQPEDGIVNARLLLRRPGA